jgi:hypothetical protein
MGCSLQEDPLIVAELRQPRLLRPVPHNHEEGIRDVFFAAYGCGNRG